MKIQRPLHLRKNILSQFETIKIYHEVWASNIMITITATKAMHPEVTFQFCHLTWNQTQAKLFMNLFSWRMCVQYLRNVGCYKKTCCCTSVQLHRKGVKITLVLFVCFFVCFLLDHKSLKMSECCTVSMLHCK